MLDSRPSLFELRGIDLSRAGEPVLRGIDARLPEGPSCIAGPSGCGKSSLLRLLNRLADPDRGEVRYRGADVADRDVLALRREVCLVPQLPALIEGTVEDNVRFAAHMGGADPDLPRLLELAGLDSGYAERDASRLSVGEQQRAMLARALALEPSVLLLDEPTSALDATATEAVEAALKGLRERLGLSWVLVTHDLAQARRLADWVVRLDAGRVTEQGAVEGVLRS